MTTYNLPNAAREVDMIEAVDAIERAMSSRDATHLAGLAIRLTGGSLVRLSEVSWDQLEQEVRDRRAAQEATR